MYRALRFFWRQYLAVAAGVAVASAVLTGALLVGDSVRGSLLEMTEERLGDVDYALVGEGFFSDALARRLADASAAGRTAALIQLPAGARHGTTRQRASGVNLYGVETSFLELFPEAQRPASWELAAGSRAAGSSGAVPTILNTSLAEELGAKVGDVVILSFPKASQAPRASLLGRRDAGAQLETLRAKVEAVLADRGPAIFSLSPHQGVPFNAFLPLDRLQRDLGREDQANVILVAGVESSEAVDASLRQALSLGDLGLRLLPAEGELTVESSRFVLRDEAVEALEALADELGAPHRSYLTYLANVVRAGEATIPYSSATAVDGDAPDLTLLDGSKAPSLEPGELLLNAWAAQRLGLKEPGALVELEYFVVGDREQLSTQTASFRFRGTVAMDGLGADPRLTPEFPGIHDADNISDWDPPFPVELSKVGPADEEYWDSFRAAPKVFVNPQEARRLWSTRFGSVTGVRLRPAPGMDLEGLAAELRRQIPQHLPLEPLGLRRIAVRSEGLAAARGATDFSGLFLAFSWFLILAAVLLVALLFSLAMERRASEVGLLRSLGFSQAKTRRRFLAEGGLVAIVGAALGLAGGIAYAAALMAGLRSWWLPAVGSQRLFLHIRGASLGTGFAAAVLVTLLAIFLSLRKFQRIPTPVLLAGSVENPKTTRRRSRSFGVFWVSLGLGGLFLAWALSPTGGGAASFFGAGAALLVAGLAAFSHGCRRAQGAALRLGSGALVSMAIRNTARNPGRSILSVSLVACAAFVIVAAGANRRADLEEELAKSSGTGGYHLLAHSEIPLFEDLSKVDDQLGLGIGPETSGLLAGAEIFGLRELPGDDASCLNLFRVERPRVLGVPPAFIERGGFTFHAVSRELPNPWELLEGPLAAAADGEAVIPAVADFETAQWILKKGLGDELVYEDEKGGRVRLRLAALLESSIFQSDLLVADTALREHFPSVAGASNFLLTPAPETDSVALAGALEGDLADFGFDVTSTAGKLASYKAVQNTYISTFQTLGGLGLLLGTLGLAVVLLRNVLERRGELAALRAFGFRRRRLSLLVLLENVFLLGLGLAVGTFSAAVAALPYLMSGISQLPWKSLLATLAAVFVVGTLACAAAAARALRAHLIPALKGL